MSANTAQAPRRFAFLCDGAEILPAAAIVLSLLAHGAVGAMLMSLPASRADHSPVQAEMHVALLVEPTLVAPPSIAEMAPSASGDAIPAPAKADHPDATVENPAPPIGPPSSGMPTQDTPLLAKPTSQTASALSPKRATTAHIQGSRTRSLNSPLPSDPLAPVDTRSAANASALPIATGPLIPPRPVAGMEANGAPAYPDIALRRREEGRVLLRVSVSADGTPLEVELAETSGHPSLDLAAISAVRQWRFVPATQTGRPVSAIALVPVRFRLDN